ncbi:MAG: IS110 family transposase [Nitrospirae bacterium]|nr:MAG: IS110 family transposase [Nitrospirota bacterium]
MRRFKKVVGIDVAKETVVASIYDGKEHKLMDLRNDPKSIEEELIRKKGLAKGETLIVMENTGTYHLRIACHLSEQLGYPVSIINPFVIKKFAERKLKRVKTDQVDAKLIAEYGMMEQEEIRIFRPKARACYEIDSIIKTIDGFQGQVNGLLSRIENMNNLPYKDKEAERSLKRAIGALNREIKKLEKRLEDIIDQNFKTEKEVLKKIPRVGSKLTAVVLGIFGRFENFERAKEVTSYIGICPSPYISGKSVRGSGRISKRGNAFIRKTLYVCALSASRYNKGCKELYERMIENGKRKRVALIAVANKLIRQIFGVLKNMREYDPDYHAKVVTFS